MLLHAEDKYRGQYCQVSSAAQSAQELPGILEALADNLLVEPITPKQLQGVARVHRIITYILT